MAYIGEALTVAHEHLKAPHVLAAFKQFESFRYSQVTAAAAAGGVELVKEAQFVQAQQVAPQALMARFERETMLLVGLAETLPCNGGH